MKRFTPIALTLLVTLSSFLSLASLPVSALAVNEVPNPSVETVSPTNSSLPTGWQTGNWGTNTTVFTYDTTGHTGTRSLKVQMTKYTSGDAKWYFTPQPVTSGASYTYSDYYESTVATSLVAQYDNGNGVYTYVTLNSKVAASSTWKQLSATFTAPAGVENVTMFHLISSVGTLSIDDVSLTTNTTSTPTPTAPTVNLTSPIVNAAVTGTVNLAATAGDANGVAKVQFQVDGISVGGAITTSPYQTTWDSTTATNGKHSITAVATNIEGLSTTSTPVSVTVNNTVSTPPVTPPTTPTNLIANPSLETVDPTNSAQPQNWLTGGWGTNTSTFSYLSTGAEDGSRSAQVKTTAYTSGDAKWYFTPLAVTAGSTYEFSDYYKATIATDVVVQFDNGSGAYSYLDLGTAATATTWTQYTGSFTVPTGMKNATVFHLIAGVGTLQTDNFSLTLAPAVVTPPTTPTSNLILNPSVETADPTNANMPLDWQSNSWGTNTTTFSYLTTGGHTGNRAVQVTTKKYTDGDAKWFFNPVDVTPDTQYTFSDYYKATIATEVDVAFDMSDGSIDYEIVGLPEPSANTWANFTTSFSVPEGAVDMTVYHLIHGVGTLTLDDESLQSYVPVGFNRPLLTLTFDDGYDDEYTEGLPLLQKYGFNSTQFIITDLVNTSGYMTTAELQAFAASGSEMASHTVTHTDLLTETPTEYDNEISASKTQLSQMIGGIPVTDMAYPNGLYNAGIVNETKLYYTGARGVEDGLNSKDNFNAYDIKVQNIYNTTTTAQVADWVAQAQATNTWLVLVYHSIDTDAADSGIYNATPTQLDSQLAAIKSSGIVVETMQQALNELIPQL